MLWAVWLVLAAAVFARPVRSALVLLFDPDAGDTVHGPGGAVLTGAAADAARAHLTAGVAWAQLAGAAGAVGLLFLTQLRPGELGLTRTARSRYVPGRGVGAGAAYVFILAAAAAMTVQLMTQLHLSVRGYPESGDLPHSPALAGAYLFGSVAAGVGEEILLSAAPVMLARRAGWSPAATIALLLVLRWSIHAYYGWTSFFVLIWIPAGYALYRAAGSIWPLITGHAVYDGLLFSHDIWPHLADVFTLISLAVALAGAVFAGLGYNRYWHDRQAGRLHPLPVG